MHPPVGNDEHMTAPNGIPSAPADAPIEELTGLLDAAGCLVLTDMFDLSRAEVLRDEMSSHMAAARIDTDKPDDFYPGQTRRVTALVSRSAEARAMVVDPLIGQLTSHHLGSNCEHHQIHVTAALEIGPGAREQILHREEDSFPYFELPRPNIVIATMWAISDFTAGNGGTLLVPGSHTWDAARVATPDEVCSAEMTAGSVLVWLGGTLHGGGANITEDEWRYGVILTYSLGWVRQEENQSLDIPHEQAATFDPELRRLTGHSMHGALGLFDPSASFQSASR